MGKGWGKRTGGVVKDQILSLEIKQQITTAIKAGLQALQCQCRPPCRKKAWQNQGRVWMTAQKSLDSGWISSEIWRGIQTNRWRTDMQEKVLNWANATQHKEDTVTGKWQKLSLTFYTGLQQITRLASTIRNHPEIWPVGLSDKTSSSPLTKTSYFCFPINNAT